jgi:hypothetical protein
VNVDLAELGYSIDTSGLKSGSDALDQFSQKNQQAAAAVNTVSPAGAKAKTATDQYAESLRAIQRELIAFAGNLGFAGTLLASLGPGGLAVAAALGVVTQALSYLSDEANRMGVLAQHLKEVADTTGLTTTQLQALQVAGQAVGLSSDQVTTSVERFTVQLASLRQGTGPLYLDLMKINPALVTQMASTKDAAHAWDLLSQAFKQAGANANQLSTSAFGRGGIGTGRLLDATTSQGGIDAMSKSMTTLNSLTKEQVDYWTALKTQIDQTNQRAENIRASYFTTDVLERLLQAAQLSERIAIAAKDSSSWFHALSMFVSDLATGAQLGVQALMAGQGIPSTLAAVNAAPAAAAKASLARGLSAGQTTDLTQWTALDDKLTGVTTAQEKLTKAQNNNALSTQFVAAQSKVLMGVLGAAATTDELLIDKSKQLAAVVGVPQSMIDRQKQFYAVQLAGSDLQILVTNNLATAEQLRAQHLAELNQLIIAGRMPADQLTASMLAYEKVVEDTVKQEQVRAASLTQLKQLELDAGSLRNQLDLTATDSLRNLSTGLTDVEMQTVTLSAGFKNLEQQVIKSLLNMLNQMLIIAPIAKGLQAALGSFLPGSAGLTNIPQPGMPGAVGFSAMGNVMTSSGPMSLSRYAGGGVASGAQLAVFGEGSTPEAFVPLPDGRSIPVNIRMPAGGVSSQPVVVNNYAAPGTKTEVQQRNEGGVNVIDLIHSTVNDGMSTGKYDSAQRARFGVPLKPRAR